MTIFVTWGYSCSLAAQVLANVQVTIKNVHVRYEDTTAIKDHPFACGWTLDELIAHTTDAHGSLLFARFRISRNALVGL